MKKNTKPVAVTDPKVYKSFSDKVDEAFKRKVKKTYRPKLPKNFIKNCIYDMTSPVRGRCVIFANSAFPDSKPKLEPLQGYIRDAKLLARVFEELHFKVQCYENKSANFITRKLKSSASNTIREIEGQPNAFVSVILSHGNETELFGSNYVTGKTPEEILKYSDIKNIINNKNCAYLQDRPKLIFIQACQGRNEDSGIAKGTTECNIVDLDDSSQDSQDSKHVAEPAGSSEVNVDSENVEISETIPTASDIMICYSTVSGYQSYVRHEGSIFGVALARALIFNSHNTDLQSLLNIINSELKFSSTRVGPPLRRVKQISQVTLTGWSKRLFFNPGYPKTTTTNSRRKANSPAEDITTPAIPVKKLDEQITEVIRQVVNGNQLPPSSSTLREIKFKKQVSPKKSTVKRSPGKYVYVPPVKIQDKNPKQKRLTHILKALQINGIQKCVCECVMCYPPPCRIEHKRRS